MDSDSDEEKYYVSEDAEDDKPCPPSRQSSVSEPPSPDFSASSSEDEDDVGNMAGQQPQPCLWTLPPQPRRRVVHTFTGAPNGKSREAAHITSESTPLSILLLFFTEIITLLVVKTNCYYHQFLENSDVGHSPEREVTEAEMFAFLALTLQMGHTVQGILEDYWTKMEQLRTPFCGQTMARARYYHILRYNRIYNNRNGVDRTDDRLWKIRDLFEIIMTNFSKFYNPSEYLAVDEVIVKFKGRIVFKQYILSLHGTVVLSGYLNCKHVSWNNASINKNGSTLLSYCLNKAITINYPNQPTHFPHNSYSSVLDIALSQPCTTTKPQSVPALSSDHNPIVFKVHLHPDFSATRILYDYRHANWPLF